MERKYISTFNENMEIVNKSNLDNWSGDTISPEKMKSLKKKLRKVTNVPMVNEIKETLAKYDIGVYGVEKAEYISTQKLRIPNELGIEYRLMLGN